MTKRLFDQDSYCCEFKAVVEKVIPVQLGYHVVLDQTAFFPESGGQSADTGLLNGLEVTGVQEKDGVIYHIMNQPLEPGEEVFGVISWDERYDKMQQHSAEHIVSGLVYSRFGYHNVGFHLGNEICTMDFDGPLTKEQLWDIECFANEAVYEDLLIEVLYPSGKELSDCDYRSKIEMEGSIRLVQIMGYDLCACCAPHLHRTGEIGLIKLIERQNYKGGVRISMVSGRRALVDYDRKKDSISKISEILAAKEEMVTVAVERLKQENEELRLNLRRQQMLLVSYKAKDISTDTGVICCFESELQGEAPRELVNRIIQKGVTLCAVFYGAEDGGYRYVLGGNIDDVRPIGRELNEKFQGHGGGSSKMVRGLVKGDQEAIGRFFDNYKGTDCDKPVPID